jgi:hypothetical protein
MGVFTTLLPFVGTLTLLPFVDTLTLLPFVATLTLLPFVATLTLLPFVATLTLLPFVATLTLLPFVATLTLLPFVPTLTMVPFVATLTLLNLKLILLKYCSCSSSLFSRLFISSYWCTTRPTCIIDRNGSVMVGMVALSAVNREFEPGRVNPNSIYLVFVASPLSTWH